MYILALHEALDSSAMAHSMHWYRHVFRSEVGDVLRKTLEFEVEGEKRKVEKDMEETSCGGMYLGLG